MDGNKDCAGFSTFVSINEHDAPDMFQRFTNDDLPFDGSDIEEATHVQSRLIVKEGQTIQSISQRCLEKLFDTVGMEHRKNKNIGQRILKKLFDTVGNDRRERIGGLVLATCFPGNPQTMAEEIARDFGINGEIYGIDKACSGFPAAVEIAVECAKRRRRTFVVITSEILSAMINWEIPSRTHLGDNARARGKASKLFADKTAAVLVKPPGTSYRFEILDAHATNMDDPHNCLELTPVEGSYDIDGNVRVGTVSCINMPGKGGARLKKTAPRVMVASIRESIQRAIDRGILSTWENPTNVIHHQANGTMVEIIQEELELQGLGTQAKVWDCIRDMGNVSAVSILAAMEMMQDELDSGTFFALPAVGAGGPGFLEGSLSHGCVFGHVV